MALLDYSPLMLRLEQANLDTLAEALPLLIERNLNAERSGDLLRWLDAFNTLPALTPSSINLDTAAIRIGETNDTNDKQKLILEKALRTLHPWRKGPFDVFGIQIDTEWRSDLKWNRLTAALGSLAGQKVLDVGCGSGYHCWRMRGAGADLVIGIEPTLLFVMQFHAIQRYINDSAVHVVPARLEELPAGLECFDTTFSMGVLYHRRSPFDHLAELKNTLKAGGLLVLETLVIDGKAGETLVPEGRYGKMGNVWFLPSPATLESWLRKAGYQEIRCVDISITTQEEQRSTPWMTFQSLSDFLDPADSSKTIEGHPAPRRALFMARKPV